MNTKSDGFKVLLGVVASIVAIVVFGLLLSIAPELARGPQATATPGGISAGQYRDVPNVTLVDQNNKPTTFKDLQGKTVLMIFGYTHCPDVCPMTMSDFRKAKRELGEAANNVYFVFVGVDSKRDTPAALKRYVEAFDPAFIGLTGDDATLQKTVFAFDGVYEIQKASDDNPDSYTVAHTSFIYLIDAQGKWRLKYPFGTPVETLVRDIREIGAKSAQASAPGLPMASPLSSPIVAPVGDVGQMVNHLIDNELATFAGTVQRNDTTAARNAVMTYHNAWHLIQPSAMAALLGTQYAEIDTYFHSSILVPIFADRPDFAAISASIDTLRARLRTLDK